LSRCAFICSACLWAFGSLFLRQGLWGRRSAFNQVGLHTPWRRLVAFRCAISVSPFVLYFMNQLLQGRTSPVGFRLCCCGHLDGLVADGLCCSILPAVFLFCCDSCFSSSDACYCICTLPYSLCQCYANFLWF
jgi:hypothetical protein